MFGAPNPAPLRVGGYTYAPIKFFIGNLLQNNFYEAFLM